MRIKITADSTCDLSPELISENNITITPLKIIKGGKTFTDGVDITPADIFAHVAAGGELCSTAAVNVDDYRSVFKTFSKEYDAVIHINIGSDFSCCYQDACIAAEDFDNVYVIDSKNLSTGQGHIVMEACERAKTCTNVASLVDELNELTSRVEASFVMNYIDYMVKGGRCSSVAALGANLLNLKLCIEVADGKMRLAKKYRGTYTKCLLKYVKERLEGREDILPSRLFITHSPVSKEDVEAVKEEAAKYVGFEKVYDTDAGCTVCCHCGPGTLGILFMRNK